MPSKSKTKGHRFERELVRQAQAIGLDAERARGSDGRALGEASEVDLIVSGVRIQAKRRKKLAAYLIDTGKADCCVFRQDRGDSFVLISWHNFLSLLKDGGV